MYQHILIATDGSELAQRGVDQGLSLAARIGAKATILTVTEPMRSQAIHAAKLAGIADPVSMYDQQIDAEMKEQFAALEQEASRIGVSVELVHEIDHYPAEAILRVADLRGCDLIVMTSHGRRGASRLLLGSQTAEVVSGTRIPVLVVR